MLEDDLKMKKKIIVVFGTRPEAIKMAPLVHELKRYPEYFETKVAITAQHREMLDQVLSVFDIEVDYDLDIMKRKQSLSNITANVLKGLEEIYIQENPDMVLVHGDTTTSFTAALAAYYHQIAIGHVESGLRTYDKNFPFPEEANRQLIDNLADIYFVPTKEAKTNLLKENKNEECIFVTGNTAIDAIKYTEKLPSNDPLIKRMTDDKKWILLTMHRRENHGQPMESVFEAVLEVVKNNENVAVIMPAHLSPIVQAHVKDTLANQSRIHITGPLSVEIFHKVMTKASLVITDSGGLQEEAPALDIPVLVLRDKTERPEGEVAGTLKVIGTNKETVFKEIELLLNDGSQYDKMAKAINPYGDGKSSGRIVKIISSYFEEKR